MFFITFSSLWSTFFFLTYVYILFIAILTVYLLPIMGAHNKYVVTARKTYFNFVNSFNFLWIVLVFFYVLLLHNFLWVSPTISAWFGHLTYSKFQGKFMYFIIFTFVAYFTVLITTTYFTSKEIYDFIIVNLNFFFWITILFCSNTIFTLFFVIEALSSLVFLLLITSTFSTSFFYRNLSLDYGHKFQSSLPHSFVQSLLFLFWISLISSLNLFLFLVYFYLKLLSFDWYLLEYVFLYYISMNSKYDILGLGMVWLVLVFCFFLKCGIAPLYVWKPVFFKGLQVYTLFFYICVYYFFLFIYVLYFLVFYLSEIFTYYLVIFWLFILSGLLMLVLLMCESYYFKAFLAISSIFNSLLLFLLLSSFQVNDAVFVL